MKSSDIKIDATTERGRLFQIGVQDRMREYERRDRVWAMQMVGAGCVATHPDDGWVNREAKSFALVYPQFSGGIVTVGSLVALGNHRSHRLVRVTGVRHGLLGSVNYEYEEV